MKKLLVLFLVAAMCIPSYGSILVYKTSTLATVFDLTEGKRVTETERGYLVVDIDLDTQDVNTAQQITYSGVKAADKEQRTVPATVVFHNVAGYIVADYSCGDTDAVLSGKTSDGKAVGLEGEDVAKSLKGSMLTFPNGLNELSSGTVTATLDTKLTKDKGSEPIADVVDYIVYTVLSKYTPIVDTTAPTPDPMQWATPPTATSDTTITMTAAEATDAESPPAKYFFTNVNVAGHNSGWQDALIYTDVGLTADTNYTYTVKAQDSSPAMNETAASDPCSATTLKIADTNKPIPSPMLWAAGGEPNAKGSDSSITMSAWDANDEQGVDGYYFTCVTDGNKNSGLLPADANADNWNYNTRTWICTGLLPAHTYKFNVKAQDKARTPNVTLPSTPDVNATTATDITGPTPATMAFAVPPTVFGSSAITMTAVEANDVCGVEYKFTCAAGGGNDSAWQDSRTYLDTGLTGGTWYAYAVQARDKSPAQNTNTQSTPVWANSKTLGSIQSQINAALVGHAAAGYPLVTVDVNAGMYKEDLLINEPNVLLRSVDGAANTTIQLKTENMGIDVDANGCTIGGSADHGFTIIGGTSTISVIDTHDDTEVSYCDINSVGAADRGVRVGATAPGVTIKNNAFVIDTDDSAIYLSSGTGYVENVDISNNTCTAATGTTPWAFVEFSNTDGNSITIDGTSSTDCDIVIGLGGTGKDLNNVTISDNIFNHGSGIYAYEYTAEVPGDPCRLNNVSITGNTFAAPSNGSALVICDDSVQGGTGLEPNDVNWASVVFTGNSILRTPGGTYNTVDNMIGAAGAVLKAKPNYWNAADGPSNGCTCSTGAGASISNKTYIDFENFYTDALMTADSNCGVLCP